LCVLGKTAVVLTFCLLCLPCCLLVNLSPARGKTARGRGRGRGRKTAKKEESSDEGEEELMNEDETGGMGRTIIR